MKLAHNPYMINFISFSYTFSLKEEKNQTVVSIGYFYIPCENLLTEVYEETYSHSHKTQKWAKLWFSPT